jgi:hypothetical protein
VHRCTFVLLLVPLLLYSGYSTSPPERYRVNNPGSDFGKERKLGKVETCPRPMCESETLHKRLIRDGLLVVLAKHYVWDSTEFITLSRQFLDSALAREVVAQLRNEGYLEEKVRGTIRLTALGYMAFQNDPAPGASVVPRFAR